MESQADLNTKIMELLTIIQEKHPELTPYIGEMPITVPSDSSPEVNSQILQDYYDSLNQIVTNHIKNRPEDDIQ